MNSIQYMKMLLPLQGAIDDGYNTPRVSAHMVRLALGCVLLAFQAVMETGYNVHTSSSALKGQHLLAQGTRPQERHPGYVVFSFTTALKGQKPYNKA